MYRVSALVIIGLIIAPLSSRAEGGYIPPSDKGDFQYSEPSAYPQIDLDLGPIQREVATAAATPIAKATPVGAFGFQTGQMVLLTNLQHQSMNGSRGIVESFVANGRVNVRLSDTKVVCVKPENLEAGAELLD